MSGLLSLVLVLATVLGGTFGDASATATPAGDGRLNVEFTVEVSGQADAVVAHIVDIGGDQWVTSLAPEGAGKWTGVTETDATNLVVVFEAIRGDDSSDMSQPATFATLGVDPDLIGMGATSSTTTTDAGYSQRTKLWGWGALFLAALALAFLALWAAGGRPRRHKQEPEETVPEPEEDEAPDEPEV